MVKAFIKLTVTLLFMVGTSYAQQTKIGLILPLTGDAALLGQSARAGFDIGLRDHGCNDKAVAIYEDDALDPKRSVTAYRKLHDVDTAQLIFTFGSGPSGAVAPLSAQDGVTLFSLAGDAKIAQAGPNVVRLRPAAPTEGKAMAEFARESGVASITILCAESEYTQQVCNGIEQSKAVSTVNRIDVTPSETDFRSIANQVRQNRPEAIGIILTPGKIGLAAKTLREQALTVPLFGTSYVENKSEVATAQGALEGARYVTFGLKSGIEAPALRQMFQADAPLYAASFYDFAFFACSAISAADPLSALRTGSAHEGTLGSFTFKEEAGDRFLDYPYRRKVVKNGSFETIGRAENSK